MKASKTGLCTIGMRKTRRQASRTGIPTGAGERRAEEGFFVPGFGTAKENWAMASDRSRGHHVEGSDEGDEVGDHQAGRDVLDDSHRGEGAGAGPTR